MGSSGQWQFPAHFSLSDPYLSLHEVCLSFPGIQTASCSHCHYQHQSSLCPFEWSSWCRDASQVSPLTERTWISKIRAQGINQSIISFLFLFAPIIFSLVAAQSLEKDKGIFRPLHPTKKMRAILSFFQCSVGSRSFTTTSPICQPVITRL